MESIQVKHAPPPPPLREEAQSNYCQRGYNLSNVISIDCTSQLCNSPLVTRVTRRVSHVEQELLTHLEHLSVPPVFSGASVARSLALCVLFFRSFFVILSFIFWPLCGLSFFNLWILIINLVSSNSS